MSVSAPFITRPIATALLSLAVLIAGGLGFRLLPVSSLPEIDFPTVQVSTQLPGASPDTMASLVTTPLEQQLGQIAGVTLMTSTSSFGISVITMQFVLDRDIDSVGQDVQAAINAAAASLPSGLPYPPVYKKVNPADQPILILALTSEAYPITKIQDIADTVLAQKLSEVTGVGAVTIQGGQKPAVRVQVNPAQLAAYNLSLEQVRTVLGRTNVDQPKGSFDGPNQAFTIAANDQILVADSYADVILAYRNGAPVRVRDVGTAVHGAENAKVGASLNGQPAVILDVQRQPASNIIQTVDRIQELLPRLRAGLPPEVRLTILSDRTQTIRASIADVEFTLMLTTALVVLVMFLFLRRFWATVIPSVAIPLSIVGTFGVMYLAGFGLDNLSLMALTVATGFLVDDAIVMIENIVRRMEDGETALEAAYKGARQIGFTIVSLTVSIIAVFIPLLFMRGIVGRLFREFSVTLSVTIVVSAIVSLTLTPMMCGHLLRREQGRRSNAFLRISEHAFAATLALYERSLAWVMRREAATLAVAVATLLTTIMLYLVVPKGFLPVQDTGVIVATTDAEPGISFHKMVRLQARAAEIALRDADVAGVDSFVGVGLVNSTPNTGRLTIVLKRRDQRTESAAKIARRLRSAMAQVEGLSIYLQPAPEIQIGTRTSRTQYQYILVDANPVELADWASRLLEKLRSSPSLQNVASDQQTGGLAVDVVINRDKAGQLGVLPQTIDDTLYDAFGQRQVSTIYTQQNQYHVVLEVAPDFQLDPIELGRLYVPSSQGVQVPLESFATVRHGNAPLAITHQGLFSAVTLSFDPAPGVSLGGAVRIVRESENAIGMPDSVIGSFAGEAAEFQASLASEVWLILAAVIAVYIVLGVLYESTIHPITILSTLPSAGIGALIALMITGNDLSLIAVIAIILLIGIVKKNAIIMIDFALDAERTQGLQPRQAIFDASLKRFRPIMMTTMAALLGAVPLAFGTGPGSELRRPLGIAIIGGLLLSQFLTLYTTPVIYVALDRVQTALRQRMRMVMDTAE
ncbi:acriflavine resistance protein B [Bradyrhizobium centrolobii]|uniref:Acriflavine resistance protein B n=1 Tax=Bradyrhizobium centrolobii TaxID=1505087 RepID=A0A176YIX5_9BRAD|nr:efflux RND transporter permease subunit [Bradyrhizobium centrolobii]OAF05789.1 acriflavine resistance protein B [Bradyrhizobium centrolobii]